MATPNSAIPQRAGACVPSVLLPATEAKACQRVTAPARLGSWLARLQRVKGAPFFLPFAAALKMVLWKVGGHIDAGSTIRIFRGPLFRSGIMKGVICCHMVFVAVAYTSVATSNVAYSADDASSVKERLQAQWAGQRSALVNGRFKLKVIFTSCVKPLPRDHVNTLLSEADLLSGNQGLTFLYDSLCSPDPDRAPVAHWVEYDLAIQDGKAVQVGKQRLKNGEMVTSTAQNGSSQVDVQVTPESKQAVITTGKERIRQLRLSDLRLVPASDSEALAPYQVRLLTDGKIELTGKDTTLVVDLSTGFVDHAVAAAGNTLREIRQYGRVQNSDGVIFPRALVSADYREGNLVLIKVIVVDEATFNEDLGEKAFTVAAPTGTVVFDRRQPGRSRPVKLDAPVDDLVGYMDARDHRSTVLLRRNLWLTWVGITLVILLIPISLFLVARRYTRYPQ